MRSARIAIVGGGPAGLSTALFLAHERPELTSQIVVLEKGRYPRDKICAGAVGARADRLLEGIGVRVDVPSVPIHGFAYRADRQTAIVRDEEPIGRVVRRIEYDHALARAVMERGIDVVDGAKVDGIRPHSNHVELSVAGSRMQVEVLVGADGVGSIVRRALGFGKGAFRAQALEVDTEIAPADFDRDLLVFDTNVTSLRGYYWDFPTVLGGRQLVSRGVYLLREDDATPAADIQDVLANALAQRGLDLRDYPKRRFSERGFGLHEPVCRPRVLLVGEAAGIDPVTGEGIAQAIQYGAVAGRYLARKLASGELAFVDYARTVQRSNVGRDLTTRSSSVALFYGASRPATERFLLTTPDFLRMGMRYFGGHAWRRGEAVRSTLSLLRHFPPWRHPAAALTVSRLAMEGIRRTRLR